MATIGSPPVKNVAFTFPGEVRSQADSTTFKSAPTIAAGDFMVSIDSGAYANLTNLPTASLKIITFVLTAAEMNGDCIRVKCEDAAGAEWVGRIFTFYTAARQINDLAFPTVSGRSLDVTATGAAGIDWANVENPTTALNLSATNIDVDQIVASVSGAVGSVTGAVGSVTGAVGSVTGNVGGNVVGSAGSVTGAVGSVTGNVGGNVAGSVGSVTARVTANTDQLGGQTVTAAAGVTVPSSIASPTNITAGTITTVTNLTNAPTAGDLTATMKTSVTTAATAATPIAASVSGNVVGSIGSLATQAKADVNAEVVDGLNVDTYAEPASVPAATASLAAKIGYLFTKARNKITQTATTQLLRNDADSATIATTTVSDDSTTFTKSEDV